MEIIPVEGHELGDVALVMDVGMVLDRHYPGHPWIVFINDEEHGGVLNVLHAEISYFTRPANGMVIRLKELYQDPDRRLIVRWAGELLERAGQARGRWRDDVPVVGIEGIPVGCKVLPWWMI